MLSPNEKDGAAVIDMGMKMFLNGEYIYTVKFLARVNLVDQREPLRARAIANAKIGKYQYAYKDFKRYFTCFGGFIDKEDFLFVDCLVDSNIFMRDFNNTLKVLWIVFNNYPHDKLNTLTAFCMFNLEYYSDAAIAITNIPCYQESPLLFDMLRICEEHVLISNNTSTYLTQSEHVKSFSNAIYELLTIKAPVSKLG